MQQGTEMTLKDTASGESKAADAVFGIYFNTYSEWAYGAVRQYCSDDDLSILVYVVNQTLIGDQYSYQNGIEC
jgi:hypothetical protein